MSLTYSTTSELEITTTNGKVRIRKRAFCPRCGWIAIFIKEECDEQGCWNVYQCTRCLYVFRVKKKF